MAKTQPLIIRNFLGVNRKDGGDKALDNEFYAIQNWYQATKGFFYKRNGSTDDVTAASIPGAKRISGIHRHYNKNGDKFMLYHCEPDTSSVPDTTTDLVLAELSDGLGTIFNGGAVSDIRVCYTFIGLGLEQTPNSKNRAGFLNTSDLDSWNNPGHQVITLSDPANSLSIQAPITFPSGIRAVNVFVSVGSSCQMTYIGTISSPGGSLVFRRYIGPSAASADAATGAPTLSQSGGGSLNPGTYFISTAWLVDGKMKDNPVSSSPSLPKLSSSSTIVLTQDKSTINVSVPAGSSTNGATAVYVFIGLKDQSQAPMMCAGICAAGGSLAIDSIPSNTNAQSHPVWPSNNNDSFFANNCNVEDSAISGRYGFVIKKDKDGNLAEVFPSRGLEWSLSLSTSDPINGGTIGGFTIYWYAPKTANDTNGTPAPFDWGRTVYDPCFTYLNGTSYFANGVDVPWMTDGYGLGNIVPANGTLLPPFPRFIFAFKNQLIAAGAGAGNQVYASNSLAPFNWATGGTGTEKRFVTAGDLFGDDVAAAGVFTLSNDAVNDPRSFWVAFKKNGVWMKDSFPDPTSGVGSPMEELSGRVGCLAYRSICSTPLGLFFLGSDGHPYLIRSASQPARIGTKVQPLFAHLVKNDDLMKMVTAVFHDDHLKISYPNASDSIKNDAQIWADLRTEDGPITWVGPHTGINIGPQIVRIGEGDDGARIGCLSDGSGTVVLDDTSTFQDRGASITSILEWKNSRFGAEMHEKRYVGAHIDAYYDTSFAHDLLVEFFADEFYAQRNIALSSGSSTWDSSSWDQSLWGSAQFNGIPALLDDNVLVGRTLKYKLTHSNNAQFIVAAIGLILQPERRLIV